jgi:hypothetical protein
MYVQLDETSAAVAGAGGRYPGSVRPQSRRASGVEFQDERSYYVSGTGLPAAGRGDANADCPPSMSPGRIARTPGFGRPMPASLNARTTASRTAHDVAMKSGRREPVQNRISIITPPGFTFSAP